MMGIKERKEFCFISNLTRLVDHCDGTRMWLGYYDNNGGCYKEKENLAVLS